MTSFSVGVGWVQHELGLHMSEDAKRQLWDQMLAQRMMASNRKVGGCVTPGLTDESKSLCKQVALEFMEWWNKLPEQGRAIECHMHERS